MLLYRNYICFKTFCIIFPQENGFFVESGAFDGEYLSNSLFFERQRHWTGLLVEPVSDVFSKLRLKNRKSFCVKACLSDFPYPVQVFKAYLKEKILPCSGSNLPFENCFHIW